MQGMWSVGVGFQEKSMEEDDERKMKKMKFYNKF